MSIPRQLVIKQDKACSTPVGTFLQYRARGGGTGAHLAPVHEGFQPSAAAQSAKPRARKGQTQMLSRFGTGLWECFRALTSIFLHYFHRPPRFVGSSVQQGEEGQQETRNAKTECTIIGALHTHTHTHWTPRTFYIDSCCPCTPGSGCRLTENPNSTHRMSHRPSDLGEGSRMSRDCYSSRHVCSAISPQL